jgi:nucleoid DNA-binding protein
MAQCLSESDIYELLGIKSGTSSRTAKRILTHFKALVASELVSNNKITINGFGTFKLTRKGGKDEWYINSVGLKEKKYVEEYDFIEFVPNKNFLNAINSGDLKIINKENTVRYQKNNSDIAEKDLIHQLQAETPSTIEVVHNLIDKKVAKIENDTHRYDRLKCLNNGKIYENPYIACQELQLSKNKMYWRINKKQPIEFDGYKFEWVEPFDRR